MTQTTGDLAVETSHATRIVVWDVPSTVEVGKPFRLKVGLKCSCACALENSEFTICDAEGSLVTSGIVGSDLWPGSTALHFAEVEVRAPVVEGLHAWEIAVAESAVKAAGSEVDIPHARGSETFGVRSVAAPEFLVRVEAIDSEDRSSLQGASVVMYPYRATTDDRGVAEIWAPRGQYRLQVSRSKYLASGRSIEVTDNIATIAALDLEPVMSSDDRYS